MKLISRLFLWILLCLLPVISHSADSNNSARFLVHLLDYLAHDYSGAVAGGNVVSPSEYSEQKEFAARTIALGQEVPEIAATPAVPAKLKKLQDLIEHLADDKDVTRLAREIQAQVLTLTQLSQVPENWPRLETGARIYSNQCIKCHGEHFDGKGLEAGKLTPPPANFLDETRMKDKSPFQEFNVIRLGVPGTGMLPFAQLSDEDTWALAFYVISLRHMTSPARSLSASQVPPSLGNPKILLPLIADHSDEGLRTLPEFKNISVASLRTFQPLSEEDNPLAKALRLLDEAVAAYESGDTKKARTLALQSYLEGIEPVEPRLKANDPDAVTAIEVAMGEVRGAIDNHHSEAEVETAVKKAQALINNSIQTLAGKPLDPPFIFAAAAAILLREGFEAVLIILMLLGVLKKTGAHRAEHWVHGGWIAALALGVVAWFCSGWLLNMSGAKRELMEAFTSIFAVGVLLFVGFWLHNQTEIGRWKEFLNTRVVAALESKNLMGLAIFSFIAVFREAFETVLFLRALWLEGGDTGKLAMLGGVLSSLMLIFILAWALLRFSVKLPLQRLFGISSFIMAALAIVLAGKGVHSLQETGLMSVNSLAHGLHGELLGLYPTWETVLTQLVVLVVIGVLWQFGKRTKV